MGVTKEESEKAIEGVGIILLIAGIVNPYAWKNNLNIQSIFFILLTVCGWLLYTFSKRLIKGDKRSKHA